MTCSLLVHNIFMILFSTYSSNVQDLCDERLVHHTIYSCLVHNLFIASSQFIGNLFLIVLDLFTTFQNIFTIFSQLIHHLFRTCSRLVPTLFTTYSQLVHHTIYSCLVHDLFTASSQFVHNLFLIVLGLSTTFQNMFNSCSWHIQDLFIWAFLPHDLFIVCSGLVLDLFMTCSQLLYNFLNIFHNLWSTC